MSPSLRARFARPSPAKRLANRPRTRLILQCLEQRLAPAIATLSAGVFTIDYTATGATTENVTVTSDGTNIALTGDVSGSTSYPVGSVSKIVVEDSGGSSNQSLTFAGTSAFTLTGGLSSAGVETVSVGDAITTTGSGAISFTGGAFSTTAPMTTAGGSISLSAANGITLNDSLNSSGGTVTLNADADVDGTGSLILAAGSIAAGNGGVSISAADAEVMGTISSTATVSFDSGQANHPIDLGNNTAGSLSLTDAELDFITAGTLQIGNAISGIITVSAAITHGNDLSLTTGGSITANQSITMAVNKSLIVAAFSTITLATNASDFATSGSGSIGFTTARNIVLASGASITTVNGALSLSANQQLTPTAGDFVGIDINGGTVQVTGSGALSVSGRGGTSGNGSQLGVSVHNAGVIQGGTAGAGTTIQATGGAGTGNVNHGVNVVDVDSKITSTGDNVQVTGTGGGSGASNGNVGVQVAWGGAISAGGSGSVTVNGTGGATTGGSNVGVQITTSTAQITSNGGDVSVTGVGGGTGITGSNYGVQVAGTGKITAGSLGSVTVTGTGGESSKAFEYGVFINSTGSQITSNGGNVKVNGTGGITAGSGGSHSGVYVLNGGVISAGGLGTVEVIGKSGNSGGSGGNNIGVNVISGNSMITSSGGDVTINGDGSNPTSGANHGVDVVDGTISAGGTGNLSIVGTAGFGGNGVQLSINSKLSAGGNVLATGIEGTGTTFGILMQQNATISTSAAGNITLISDSDSIGTMAVINAGTNTATVRQRTNGITIVVGGEDSVGTALGLFSHEIDRITAGTLRIGDVNSGSLKVHFPITRSTSTNLELTSGAAIDLGAELDSLGGNITLTSSGAITQTAGVVTTSGKLTLAAASGQTATFNSAGNTAGSLIIPAGVTCLVNGSFNASGEVQVDGKLGGTDGSVGTTTVNKNGTVAPGTSAGKLTTGNIVFDSVSVFRIELNGASAGTEYDQLAVAGTINLGGTTLSATLGYSPAPGQVFTIIDNDGAGDAVTGTFNGLVERAKLNFGGTNLTISYKGGDGNDVTLTQPFPPTVIAVIFGDGTDQRSLVKQIAVHFSEAVTFSGPVVDAFTLFRHGTGGTTGNVTLSAIPPSGTTSSVTMTFSGALTEFGSLVDGFYDLTIDATKISGVGGALNGDVNATPGGNYVVMGSTANKFFRLYGDGDGSGLVDQADLVAFRNAFNSGPSATFNFEGDGNVTQSDFIQFRNRFNLMP